MGRRCLGWLYILANWRPENIKKINQLIKDIERNGNSGIGKPEPLKGDLSGFWSREIDQKNRLVYRIMESELQIIQCKTHYGDK